MQVRTHPQVAARGLERVPGRRQRGSVRSGGIPRAVGEDDEVLAPVRGKVPYEPGLLRGPVRQRQLGVEAVGAPVCTDVERVVLDPSTTEEVVVVALALRGDPL